MSKHGGRALARWARSFGMPVLAVVALLAGQVATGLSAGLTAYAVAYAAQAAHPNRFDPRSNASSARRPVPGFASGTGGARAVRPPSQPPVAPAKELGTLTLDAATGSHLLSSDGTLEIDAPGGAVTAADVSAAGGRMSLLVRQVAPASGSNAGGSGRYSFGTFLVQVLDARATWPSAACASR